MEEAIALEGPSLAAAFRFIMDLRFSLLIPPKIAPNKKNPFFYSNKQIPICQVVACVQV